MQTLEYLNKDFMPLRGRRQVYLQRCLQAELVNYLRGLGGLAGLHLFKSITVVRLGGDCTPPFSCTSGIDSRGPVSIPPVALLLAGSHVAAILGHDSIDVAHVRLPLGLQVC